MDLCKTSAIALCCSSPHFLLQQSTLHSLAQVSYNEKHNEANGEDNRDGEAHNASWNCGEEGPSTKWNVTVSGGI